MADRRTSDITIWSEDADNSTIVDSDGDLNSKAKIWDGTNEVDVIDDAGTHRLAVDANTTVTPVTYSLRTYKNDTDVDFVGDTWYTAVSITGEGQPSYVHMEFYSSNWQVRITIDGTEIFDMTNSEMANYQLQDANLVKFARGAPYRRSSDMFSWHFPDNVSYSSSFLVEVKRRSGNSAGLDMVFCVYKEKD